MQNELMKKQLENENLQHTLDIEKSELEKQKKVKQKNHQNHLPCSLLCVQKVEEAMKTEQAEVHALQKQQRALQQRLEEGPRMKQELERAQQL